MWTELEEFPDEVLDIPDEDDTDCGPDEDDIPEPVPDEWWEPEPEGPEGIKSPGC